MPNTHPPLFMVHYWFSCDGSNLDRVLLDEVEARRIVAQDAAEELAARDSQDPRSFGHTVNRWIWSEECGEYMYDRQLEAGDSP